MSFQPQILFEDNHLLVINKRSGELAQRDDQGADSVLEFYKAYLKEKFNKPGNVYLGLPHRLDRPTSGILVLARTSKAMTRLSQQFQSRNWNLKKRYLAVVAERPEPESGRLEHYLRKNARKNKSFVVKKGAEGAKLASLSYQLKASSERYHLIQVDLETGRHHQIRAQLASIGCPIRGDLKYGYPRSNPDGSLHLHAFELELEHPVKKEVLTFRAPLPNEKVWSLFEQYL
jgi:23S rRNA pseudouridine1911/1915/1917 synthase